MCSTRREQQPTVSALSSASFSFPALSASWEGRRGEGGERGEVRWREEREEVRSGKGDGREGEVGGDR